MPAAALQSPGAAGGSKAKASCQLETFQDVECDQGGQSLPVGGAFPDAQTPIGGVNGLFPSAGMLCQVVCRHAAARLLDGAGDCLGNLSLVKSLLCRLLPRCARCALSLGYERSHPLWDLCPPRVISCPPRDVLSCRCAALLQPRAVIGATGKPCSARRIGWAQNNAHRQPSVAVYQVAPARRKRPAR